MEKMTGNEVGNAPEEAPKPARKKRKKRSGKSAAKAFTAKALKLAEAEKVKVEKEDLSQYVYYIACWHFHPGVFLTGNGKGKVPNDGWFSAYREAEHPWHGKIHCQVCQREMKHIAYLKGGQLLPYPRFVKRMSREKFEEMTAEDSDE